MFDKCQTIKYDEYMKKPTERQVPLRTLYRELPRITEEVAKGQRFVVTKHGKPIAALGPIQTERGHRYRLSDFATLQWKGGPKDLSQRVDETVYGA